jgi:hypothetical protein
MFDNPTVNDTVNVHAGEYHRFSGWLNPKPRSFMRSTCSNAGNHPFAFSNLQLDRNMKTWVSLSNAKNMRFDFFHTEDMSFAIVDFAIFGGAVNSA